MTKESTCTPVVRWRIRSEPEKGATLYDSYPAQLHLVHCPTGVCSVGAYFPNLDGAGLEHREIELGLRKPIALDAEEGLFFVWRGPRARDEEKENRGRFIWRRDLRSGEEHPVAGLGEETYYAVSPDGNVFMAGIYWGFAYEATGKEIWRATSHPGEPTYGREFLEHPTSHPPFWVRGWAESISASRNGFAVLTKDGIVDYYGFDGRLLGSAGPVVEHLGIQYDLSLCPINVCVDPWERIWVLSGHIFIFSPGGEVLAFAHLDVCEEIVPGIDGVFFGVDSNGLLWVHINNNGYAAIELPGLVPPG